MCWRNSPRHTSHLSINTAMQHEPHHHHRRRIAAEGRRIVAPPCPRSTARLQSSPIGRMESFRSWSSHLFHRWPGGRRHVRSGVRLSDTLMWSWRAMFAGVTSSSWATCPHTEVHRRDRRWDSEVRPREPQPTVSLLMSSKARMVQNLMPFLENHPLDLIQKHNLKHFTYTDADHKNKSYLNTPQNCQSLLFSTL